MSGAPVPQQNRCAMRKTSYTTARISLLIHEPAHAQEVRTLLRELGYARLESAPDVPAFAGQLRSSPPDLVMLDLPLAHPTHFRLALRGGEHQPVPPVLGLCAAVTGVEGRQAVFLGVRDVLRRPYAPEEVLLRTEGLLTLGSQQSRLQQEEASREERLRERTAELEEAQIELLERLAHAAEYRDDHSGQHAQRVGRLAALLARQLGLPAPLVGLIRRAAPLHDLGKIAIPDALLLKPGRFTPEEYEQMQRHTDRGAGLLARSHFPLLQMAAEIALTHHERWDGSGYPRGLRGEAIPLPGRIVAVADVWDALTHQRPYKQPWPAATAEAEIRRQSGSQFDPAVVTAFLQVRRRQSEKPPGVGV